MNNKLVQASLVLIIVLAGSFALYNVYNQRRTDRASITRVDSVMVKLDSKEIITQSDGVIVGTVQKTEVVKVPSTVQAGQNDIVTKATILVDKYLFNPKNLTSNEIVIQAVGGTIGGQTMISDDSPSFENGQRIVAFLRQSGNGDLSIFGGRQGEYTINEDNTIGSASEHDIFANVFGEQMNLDGLEKVILSITNSGSAK
jgi:hypothetical protein